MSKLRALSAALPKIAEADKRARLDSFISRLRILIPGWRVELASFAGAAVNFHGPNGELGVALPGRQWKIVAHPDDHEYIAGGGSGYRDVGGENDDAAMLADIAAAVKARSA